MVTTRTGAAKASRAENLAQQLDQDSPLPSVEPVSPISPTPSLVISTNNLSYNISTFDANHRRRIKRGLQDSGLRMKYCTTNIDDEDPSRQTQYFYINDDVEVAIGGHLRRPRCSCGANENGVACKVCSLVFCPLKRGSSRNSIYTGLVTTLSLLYQMWSRISHYNYQQTGQLSSM